MEYLQVLYRLGGLLVIFLGLKQLGLLRIDFLERIWKVLGKAGEASGLMKFLTSLTFVFGRNHALQFFSKVKKEIRILTWKI